MKIVQSFWSKPSIKNANININDRNNGGWLTSKYNYFSWALSCLQFRNFYEDVELVTDKLGYNLLIECLKLPYTKVHMVLDALDDYHPDLWSLGKIYAYSIQDGPFIHADGDVFIWQKFNEQIAQAELLAQNKEEGFSYYSVIYNSIMENFEFLPNVLTDSIKINNGIVAVNAGILGGSNIGFFQSYTKQAIDFVAKNYSCINKINIGLFNIVLEQFLFKSLAEQKNYKVEYLLDDMNYLYDGICELTGIPNESTYFHAIGLYKRSRYICSLLEYRLQENYPHYYYKILNLLKTSQIL